MKRSIIFVAAYGELALARQPVPDRVAALLFSQGLLIRDSASENQSDRNILQRV